MLISNFKKNTIEIFGSSLVNQIVITALIISMFAETIDSLMLKWLSLSLLWGATLFYLGKPSSYLSILKDKLFTGYLVFIGWAVLSSLILSTAKSVSIIMLIPFIGGLLSYFIAYNGTDKQEFYFDWLLLGLGLILIVYTIYQKFILGDSRPTGLLSNWNTHAALLCIIILPWILRYALNPSIKLFQIIYLSFVISLFAFAMGLTLSRGALIILITGFCCFTVVSWRQRLFFKHCLIIISALILGFFLTSLFVTDNILLRLNNLSGTNSLETIGSGRHLLWLPAWQMYLDHPYFGWGLGTFHLLYRQYKPPLSDESGHFAHNDYLQFLVELGPLGLLIFICFVIFLLNRLYRLMIATWSKKHVSRKLDERSVIRHSL